MKYCPCDFIVTHLIPNAQFVLGTHGKRGTRLSRGTGHVGFGIKEKWGKEGRVASEGVCKVAERRWGDVLTW